MIEQDWIDDPVVVIASGPSLTKEDVDYCRGKARIIAVNDCWRLAPWADVLYASDLVWWDEYAGVPEFAGERWTNSVSSDAARKYGCQIAKIESKPGYSLDPSYINRLGGNSGGQAINLAILRGASEIYLLGFDMQPTYGKKHWFGSHPKKLDRLQEFSTWRKEMDRAYISLQGRIRIVNCSRETALAAYPRAKIEECLPAHTR